MQRKIKKRCILTNVCPFLLFRALVLIQLQKYLLSFVLHKFIKMTKKGTQLGNLIVVLNKDTNLLLIDISMYCQLGFSSKIEVPQLGSAWNLHSLSSLDIENSSSNSSLIYCFGGWDIQHCVYCVRFGSSLKIRKAQKNFFLSSILSKKQIKKFPISVLASKKWSNQKNKGFYFS